MRESNKNQDKCSDTLACRILPINCCYLVLYLGQLEVFTTPLADILPNLTVAVAANRIVVHPALLLYPQCSKIPHEMDREAIPDSQAKICLVFHEQKQKRKMRSFTLLWELVMCLLSTYLKYTYFQTRAFKESDLIRDHFTSKKHHPALLYSLVFPIYVAMNWEYRSLPPCSRYSQGYITTYYCALLCHSSSRQ